VRLRRARRAGTGLAVCAAASLALVPGAAAGERDADPLSLGAVEPRAAAGPVRDRVIAGAPTARAARGVDTGTYRDPDGHTVRVNVSDDYSQPKLRAQELVNFLGTLLHGNEMNRLTATLATPVEIRRVCGEGALACYFPDAEEIVVSGEDGGPTEPPRELVIAHEYGHHVATNRSNKPWSALERGTKRWSTHEGICRGIARRKIRPSQYFQNPGEAFAEAFAFDHFPDVIRWEWEIARPDAAAYRAILADVTFPWARRTSDAWSGQLTRAHRRERRRLVTPLDGRLKVSLDAPRGADFDLVLMAGHGDRVLRRAAHPRADETLRYTVCGRRSVRILVHRFDGAGDFEVTTARP
jgi:hypothetical protein